MTERKNAKTEGEAVLRMLALAAQSRTVDPEARERFARQAAVLSQAMNVKWSKGNGFQEG